jgi:hypothetical protein
MAKSQKKPVKKAEFKGYFNCNLLAADELVFEAWAVAQTIQLTDFEPLCNNGYKISFSWDEYHQGVSAALYCRDAKMDWAGYTLTAWAADIETAIKLLFYKHFVMSGEVWDVAPNQPERTHSTYG